MIINLVKSSSVKTLPALALSLLLISSPGALAQAKNPQQMESDISVLQQGLGKIEKDMGKLQKLLDNRAMLELFQRMDEIAQEVSQLRGMLEQQDHDLAGLKKRQRELYLDSDQRIRDLEITSNRAPAAAAAETDAGSAVSAPPIDVKPQAAIEEVEVLAPVIVSPPPVAVMPHPAEVTAPPITPSVTVSEERAAYQAAFDMLKEGRYKAANTAFNSFLQRYPQSSYAGNAQYWLGESNYVTRQFQQAVMEFQTVLKKYPTSNKVADAMLKLGYTHYELHEFDKATSQLQDLLKAYPKSTAARLAGKRLDRMKKEGH